MSYEDLYGACPEEDPRSDCYKNHTNLVYEIYKEDAILCTDKDEATRLAKMGFEKFLPKKLRDYVQGKSHE